MTIAKPQTDLLKAIQRAAAGGHAYFVADADMGNAKLLELAGLVELHRLRTSGRIVAVVKIGAKV